MITDSGEPSLARVARLVDLTPEQIAVEAGAPLLADTSIIAALDIEWSDAGQKASAIEALVEQLDRVACDLDTELIVACGITPASRPEVEAVPSLRFDIARSSSRNSIAQLSIDRGYINSPLASEVFARGGEVLCKPWVSRNGTRFRKSDFIINLRARTITCPAGLSESFVPGDVVEFDPTGCDHCPLRAKCTSAAPGHGRTVAIAHDERLQHRLRKLAASADGRSAQNGQTRIAVHLWWLGDRGRNRRRGGLVGIAWR